MSDTITVTVPTTVTVASPVITNVATDVVQNETIVVTVPTTTTVTVPLTSLVVTVAGSTGATGATGQGVPVGGTANQVLAKINSTDYNTQWVTPSGGVITETEIDFGATPVSEASFVITDALVTSSAMKILTSVSYAAPTGKDQDELEMDDLQLRAVAGTGNFTLYVRAADGSYLADKFKINYSYA